MNKESPMMKEYKISVIIPVFNAQDRLITLFENLLSQNGAREIEFILIDDHSSDKSYLMLEGAQEVFHNFRVFQMQNNSGPAACRNLGIEQATGDYVCFVDDDDTLGEPYGFINKRFSPIPELEYKFFENIRPFLGKSDIILCRRARIEKVEKAKEMVSHCESPIDNFKNNDLSESYQRALFMHGMQYICGNMFRRKLLVKHNIRFIPGLEPYEDLFFGSHAAYYAKTIKVSYNSVYGYHIRLGSLSQNENDKVRIPKMFLYGNRQMPVLLSHLLLKDAKHSELCRFVYEFSYTLRRLNIHLIIQQMRLKENFDEYSFINAFPSICFTCEKRQEVCEGAASCPHTAEFEKFLKESKKKFLPEKFDLNSI